MNRFCATTEAKDMIRNMAVIRTKETPCDAIYMVILALTKNFEFGSIIECLLNFGFEFDFFPKPAFLQTLILGREFHEDHLVFYHFLPSDAPFGRHIGLCVIFGIIFDFSTANIGAFCSF